VAAGQVGDRAKDREIHTAYPSETLVLAEMAVTYKLQKHLTLRGKGMRIGSKGENM